MCCLCLILTELYLGKWCFVGSQEKDLIHVDPVAAHLIFLQAQHDVHAGKASSTKHGTLGLLDTLHLYLTPSKVHALCNFAFI